jgi:hypothetical protein
MQSACSESIRAMRSCTSANSKEWQSVPASDVISTNDGTNVEERPFKGRVIRVQ